MGEPITIEFQGIRVTVKSPQQAADLILALAGTAPTRVRRKKPLEVFISMLERVRDGGPQDMESLARLADMKSPKGMAPYSRMLEEISAGCGISDAVSAERNESRQMIWTAGPGLDALIAATKQMVETPDV